LTLTMSHHRCDLHKIVLGRTATVDAAGLPYTHNEYVT
jgi:hypothetical protein